MLHQRLIPCVIDITDWCEIASALPKLTVSGESLLYMETF